MAAALALVDTEYDDGDGGGPCDPKDIAIWLLEQEAVKLRAMMRALLDCDGEEATAAIAAAEKHLNALDNLDHEVACEQWRNAGCPDDWDWPE